MENLGQIPQNLEDIPFILILIFICGGFLVFFKGFPPNFEILRETQTLGEICGNFGVSFGVNSGGFGVTFGVGSSQAAAAGPPSCQGALRSQVVQLRKELQLLEDTIEGAQEEARRLGESGRKRDTRRKVPTPPNPSFGVPNCSKPQIWGPTPPQTPILGCPPPFWGFCPLKPQF